MNYNELKDNLDLLKNMESNLNGLNMDDPEKLMQEMGIDFDELDDFFNQSMNKKIELKYVNTSDIEEPTYAYETDSGFDLRSTEDVWIFGNSRELIPTGLSFDIPEGYEIQVRTKSGIALKLGLMVLNSPGTVDCGYNAEVKVIVFNTTKDKIKIPKGQKIAQAVLCPVVNGKWVDLVKVTQLDDKDRNNAGFGSTGL